MELSQVLSGDGFRFCSEEDPEDELEHLERQKELQAELDAALDPAMIEDDYDNGSDSSHDFEGHSDDFRMSSSFSDRPQGDRNNNSAEMTDPGENVFRQRMQWPAAAAASAVQQTSTPRDNYKAPPLKTPSTARSNYYDNQQMANFRQSDSYGATGDETVTDAAAMQQPCDPVAPMYFMHDDGAQFRYDDHESEDDFQSPRGNLDRDAVILDVNNYDFQSLHPGQFVVHGGQQYLLPSPMAIQNFNPNFYQNMGAMHPPVNVGNYAPDVGSYGTDVATGVTEELQDSAHRLSSGSSVPQNLNNSATEIPLPRPTQTVDRNLMSYKVKYNYSAGDCTSATRPRGHEVQTATANNGRAADRQHEFLSADGNGENQRYEQLKILYDVREKRIQELTDEMNAFKDEKSREIRILSHQLSAAQGEKKLAEQTVEQLRQSLSAEKTAKSQVDGQMAAEQLQITLLKNEKEEIMKRLISAESTIESLNNQLAESTSTETWTRLKQQHETVVAQLRHKHESEVFHLKEQLDKSTHQITDKTEQIVELRKRVADLIRSSESAQIDRNETINRLARTLQESQDQYSKLLESGASQEFSRLRIQLQDAIAGKSITEDMNNDLKKEIEELKEHLMMFESSAQFGILPSAARNQSGSDHQNSFDQNDSYAQLCIKNPHPMKKESLSLSNSETLKNELERCLMLYGKRRQQVASLQTELKSTKENLADVNMRLETTSKSLRECQQKLKEFDACQPGQGLKEAKLERELRNVSTEKELLEKEIKELQNRLEESSLSEERANELNRDLSRQMSEMVKDHDHDKRQLEDDHKIALERCRALLLDHYETTLKQQRVEITTERDQNLGKMREEFDALEGELVKTKELYVEACLLKDNLAAELDEKWQRKFEELTTQLELKKKEALENEKRFEDLISEKEKLIDDIKANNWKQLEDLRAEIERESIRRISEKDQEIECLHLRINELEDGISQKERDFENFRLEKERQLETMRSSVVSDLEDEKSDRIRWKEDERRILENEMADKLLKAKEDWCRKQKDETQTAIKEAEDGAMRRLKQSFDIQLSGELLKAEAEWEKRHQSRLRAEIEVEISQRKTSEMNRWKELELQAELEEARKLWHATDLRRELDRARDEWTKTALVEERRVWETTALRKTVDDITARYTREIEAIEGRHKEEMTKIRESAKNEWCQRLEDALTEQEKRNKTEMEKLTRTADEHIRTEVDKVNRLAAAQNAECQTRLDGCQERLKRLQDEFDDRLTAQLNAKMQKVQKFVVQLKSQYETKLSDTDAQRHQEVDALQTELENWKEKVDTARNEITELQNRAKAMAEAKEKDDRQIELLQETVERQKAELSRLEKMWKNLTGMQESSKREHESAMEELKRKHATEMENLREELRNAVKSSDKVSVVQSEILGEIRSQYLDALHKIREEVVAHMTQTSAQSTDNMRRLLVRECRRTARRLRRYYLRCLDRLLQSDFDSSFRARTLQSMEDLLDRFIDRMHTPNSLVSSSSAYTTPRLQDDAATASTGRPAANQTTPKTLSESQPMLSSSSLLRIGLSKSGVSGTFGPFDSPWSSGSSYESFAKRLPGIAAQRSLDELGNLRPSCVTPSAEIQDGWGSLGENRLYFNTDSDKSVDRNPSDAKSRSFLPGKVQTRANGNSSGTYTWNREVFSDSEGLASSKYTPSGKTDSVGGGRLGRGQGLQTDFVGVKSPVTPKSIPAVSRSLSSEGSSTIVWSDSQFSLSALANGTQNVTTRPGVKSVSSTPSTRLVTTDTRHTATTAEKTSSFNATKTSLPGSVQNLPTSNIGYNYTSLRERLLNGNASDVSQFASLRSVSTNDLSGIPTFSNFSTTVSDETNSYKKST